MTHPCPRREPFPQAPHRQRRRLEDGPTGGDAREFEGRLPQRPSPQVPVRVRGSVTHPRLLLQPPPPPGRLLPGHSTTSCPASREDTRPRDPHASSRRHTHPPNADTDGDLLGVPPRGLVTGQEVPPCAQWHRASAQECRASQSKPATHPALSAITATCSSLGIYSTVPNTSFSLYTPYHSRGTTNKWKCPQKDHILKSQSQHVTSSEATTTCPAKA